MSCPGPSPNTQYAHRILALYLAQSSPLKNRSKTIAFYRDPRSWTPLVLFTKRITQRECPGKGCARKLPLDPLRGFLPDRRLDRLLVTVDPPADCGAQWNLGGNLDQPVGLLD